MNINPGIFAVDWPFGSWKTLIMARRIEKLRKDYWNIIFTNILMTNKSDNVFIFTDVIDLWTDAKWKNLFKYTVLDILQFIGKMDNIQRSKSINRNDRVNYYIFIDEWGIVFNQHNWQSFPFQFYDYLLQVRKINVHLIFWVQKFKNLSLQFREHVDSVFYFRSFLRMRYFQNKFWTIRKKFVDTDGNTCFYQYEWKDESWDWVTKEKPEDYHFEWIHKPSWYYSYDDLYLNKKFSDAEVLLDYTNQEQLIIEYLIDRQREYDNSTLTAITNLKEHEQYLEQKFKVKNSLLCQYCNNRDCEKPCEKQIQSESVKEVTTFKSKLLLPQM